MNLGTYPHLGLHDARAKADELSALARAGTDPAAEKNQAILARRETAKVTLQVVTDEWAATAERDLLSLALG